MRRTGRPAPRRARARSGPHVSLDEPVAVPVPRNARRGCGGIVGRPEAGSLLAEARVPTRRISAPGPAARAGDRRAARRPLTPRASSSAASPVLISTIDALRAAGLDPSASWRRPGGVGRVLRRRPRPGATADARFRVPRAVAVARHRSRRTCRAPGRPADVRALRVRGRRCRCGHERARESSASSTARASATRSRSSRGARRSSTSGIPRATCSSSTTRRARQHASGSRRRSCSPSAAAAGWADPAAVHRRRDGAGSPPHGRRMCRFDTSTDNRGPEGDPCGLVRRAAVSPRRRTFRRCPA